MRTSTAVRVQKHRATLRERGLKPIQIWVPDTHAKGFSEECKRQAMLARNSDDEQQINNFIANAADLRGWE